MYTRFFGLNEKPFAITPNPRYLYMSERHAEALAHLMYGLNEAGGFIQLTGEVGTGKTTVIRTLLEQLPQHADVALILNPALTPLEFLQAICQELHIDINTSGPHGSKQLIDALNVHLLDKHAKGRRVVVIVDEAQNLAPATLEQVRMLTNLETATHKLLQIILIGQPELREVLARSELRQLAQRITGRYHLAPLDRDDTAAYVRHRMKIAGAREDVFSESALREIHRCSDGVPRLINIICDRALLGAYTLERYEIKAGLVREAAREVAGHWRTRSAWFRYPIMATLLIVVMASGIYFWPRSGSVVTPAAVVNTPQSPPLTAKPTPTDINMLMKQTSDTSGTDSALSALFNLWGVKPDATVGSACDQAPTSGLECVYQKGVWAQLLALNRPAILQLNDDTGAVHQVVLAGLQDGNAQIILANQKHQVTVESLARYWNGDYLVLWRPQVNSQRTLSFGMRNNDVAWVRNTLSTQSVSDEPSQTASVTAPLKSRNLFDDVLMKQVIEFQRTHHLNADGVVGVQTQIALDAMLNHDHGPLLVDNPNS